MITRDTTVFLLRYATLALGAGVGMAAHGEEGSAPRHPVTPVQIVPNDLPTAAVYGPPKKGDRGEYRTDTPQDALNRGDFVKAVQLAKPLAQSGNAELQVLLGRILEKGGPGVGADPASAISWYRKAAEQRNLDGAFNLGRAYALGIGTKEDFALAEKWLLVAAQAEHLPSAEFYGALKKLPGRLQGLGAGNFGALFLTATDLPGRMQRQTARPSDAKWDEKAPFNTIGGLRTDMVSWMAAGGDGFFRVIDIRWTFASDESARAYAEKNLLKLSENLPPLPALSEGEVIAFGGENKAAVAMGMHLRQWIFLIRHGNVLAKLYLAVDPTKQPAMDDAAAMAVAQRAEERLRRGK